MTHELKKIIEAYQAAKRHKKKTVLATVVALEGSSYRRPGVRMLILENGKAIGAVSGGCVEKEVILQAQTVFTNGISKMMTYDGRYRLGCEGLLYILIEPFEPSQSFLKAFQENLIKRHPIEASSHYSKSEGTNDSLGSVFTIGENRFPFRKSLVVDKGLMVFNQIIEPCFKLLIIGAEHDAVQLSSYAALTGWEVTVVAAPSEEKTLVDFPGAQELVCVDSENLSVEDIDGQTAVLLMTHSYVKDLKFLLRVKETSPAYLGILGPAKRREKLLNELIERHPEIDDSFFDTIYGPSGLNVGAETAQEISIAILAEILAVVRGQKPIMLKHKSSPIHN
ncbi:MAG: XdhC family protein [Maribacter sp.]|nr:XdhC family protein [Maribacter sp.]